MFDGYGLAGPLSGMMIGAGFWKKTGVHVGVGVGVPAPPYLCPPLAAPPEPLQKYWVKLAWFSWIPAVALVLPLATVP
jgi:hypothetical protein